MSSLQKETPKRTFAPVPSEHARVRVRFRGTTQGISRRALGLTMNSPSRRLDSNTVPLSK